MKGETGWGTFLDDEGRFAEVDGVRYAVLLNSNWGKEGYWERPPNDNYYSSKWLADFLEELSKGRAIVVENTGDADYRFKGIFKVSRIKRGDFIGCEIGEKIQRLHSNPSEIQ